MPMNINKDLPMASPKGQDLEFPEVTIWGGEHVHVIIAMPRSLTYEQLPGLLLFISQLKEAATAENKRLHITLHFYSGKPETPVSLLQVDDQTVSDVIAPLVERHIKIEEDSRRHHLAEEDGRFEWSNLSSALAKEKELQLDGIPRLLFLFSADGGVPQQNDIPADIVSIPFDPGHDTHPLDPDGEIYPFNAVQVRVSDATRGLASHFSTLSPCEAHKRFVGILNGFQQSFGKRQLVKLFSSNEVKESFSLLNAYRSLSENKESVSKAEECDSTFAFGTSEIYFREGYWMSLALIQTGCWQDKGCSIIRNLLLLERKEWKSALPKDGEIATLPAGLYEFLKDLSIEGDKKAAGYFLNRALTLLFASANARAAYKASFLGPRLEETVPTYLREMKATPFDLFAAIFGVGGVYGTDDLRQFLWDAFQTEFPFDKGPYEKFIVSVLQPLIDNFALLSAEEKRREISKLAGFCQTFMKDIIDRRSDLLLPFVMALDIACRAVGDDKARKFNLGWMVTEAMIKIEPDVIAKHGDGMPIRYIANYLVKRELLDSGEAVKLIEWTFKFKGLEEDDSMVVMTSELMVIWQRLWPLVAVEERERLQQMFLEKGIELVRDRVEWTSKNTHVGNYDDIIYGACAPDEGEVNLPDVLADVLTEEQMVTFIAELLDTDEIRDGHVDEAVGPSLRIFHDKLGFDGWKGLVEGVMSRSEYAWRNIPEILKLTANEPRRDEMLHAIWKGLKEHNRFFSYFEPDLDYTITILEACVEEDIDDLLFWYARWASAGYSEQRQGMNQILKGHFLTGSFKKKIITAILEMATSADSEGYRSFLTHTLSDLGIPSVMLDSYDDAIHGDLWFDDFLYYMNKVEKGELKKESFWSLGDITYHFFPKVSLERKKIVVEEYLARISELHKEPLYWMFADFGRLVSQIDSFELMASTMPLFDIVIDIANAGELTYGNYSALPSIESFFDRWLDFLPEASPEIQAKVFIYFAGPLAPIARGQATRVTEDGKIIIGNSYIETALKIIIGEKGKQDIEKARQLGGYLAASPYIMLLTFIFNPELLDVNGVQGLIEGFIASGIKKADAEGFLQAGFFAFWKIDKEAYKGFLPRLLRKDIPDDLTWLALSPIRNNYLMMIKAGGDLTKFSNGLEGIDTLTKIILDEEIPVERRQYAWFCLKQISEDIANSSWGAEVKENMNRTIEDIRIKAPWLKSLRVELDLPTAQME